MSASRMRCMPAKDACSKRLLDATRVDLLAQRSLKGRALSREPDLEFRIEVKSAGRLERELCDRTIRDGVSFATGHALNIDNDQPALRKCEEVADDLEHELDFLFGQQDAPAAFDLSAQYRQCSRAPSGHLTIPSQPPYLTGLKVLQRRLAINRSVLAIAIGPVLFHRWRHDEFRARKKISASFRPGPRATNHGHTCFTQKKTLGIAVILNVCERALADEVNSVLGRPSAPDDGEERETGNGQPTEGSSGSPMGEALLESAVDAIIAIRADGTIERANPAAARLFGYTQGEFVGRNVSFLMPEPYRSEHASIFTATWRPAGGASSASAGRFWARAQTDRRSRCTSRWGSSRSAAIDISPGSSTT